MHAVCRVLEEMDFLSRRFTRTRFKVISAAFFFYYVPSLHPHRSPHTFSNNFMQKGDLHPCPNGSRRSRRVRALCSHRLVEFSSPILLYSSAYFHFLFFFFFATARPCLCTSPRPSTRLHWHFASSLPGCHGCSPASVTITMSSSSSQAQEPVHHRLAGSNFHSHLLASSTKSFIISSWCSFH